MFASRLPAQIHPSRFAQLLAEQRRAGVPLLDLTESNPTRAGFTYPDKAILAGFNDPRMLTYDPDSLGLAEARRQIAELHQVSPDRVLLTASTSEAYSWLFKLLCNPGDEILVPRPSYPLFEMLAGLESVEARRYSLHYSHGWFVDLHALEAAITPRTGAIVVVNPNNPTGCFLKRRELEAISEICARHRMALISDEVFADYPLTDDPDRAGSVSGLTCALAFVLNGLSKVVGMPQMKLGWIILAGPGSLIDEAKSRLEIIADTYLSVGTPVQYALSGLLSARDSVQAQIRERLLHNLHWLRMETAGSRISVLEVEGGWYATLRVPQTLREEQWVTELLRDYHVITQPGYFYDFESEAYLVISLLTPQGVFEEGVRRILLLARARA